MKRLTAEAYLEAVAQKPQLIIDEPTFTSADVSGEFTPQIPQNAWYKLIHGAAMHSRSLRHLYNPTQEDLQRLQQEPRFAEIHAQRILDNQKQPFAKADLWASPNTIYYAPLAVAAENGQLSYFGISSAVEVDFIEQAVAVLPQQLQAAAQ